MWAQVSNNEVVRVLAHPSNIESDGVTHPKSIFTKWSATDLKSVGIYPYSSNLIDTRYHYAGEVSYVVDTDSVTGTYATTDKDIADLKKTMISNSRSTAALILARDDWMSIRESEGGTAMASNLKSYRADVRTESGTKETEINALADMDAVKAYEATPYTQVSKVWDNDSNDWGSYTVSSTVYMNMSVHYEAVDPNAEVDPSSVSLTKD
jgi:molybdopterin converting factor small subunit